MDKLIVEYKRQYQQLLERNLFEGTFEESLIYQRDNFRIYIDNYKLDDETFIKSMIVYGEIILLLKYLNIIWVVLFGYPQFYDQLIMIILTNIYTT